MFVYNRPNAIRRLILHCFLPNYFLTILSFLRKLVTFILLLLISPFLVTPSLLLDRSYATIATFSHKNKH